MPLVAGITALTLIHLYRAGGNHIKQAADDGVPPRQPVAAA